MALTAKEISNRFFSQLKETNFSQSLDMDVKEGVKLTFRDGNIRLWEGDDPTFTTQINYLVITDSINRNAKIMWAHAALQLEVKLSSIL